MVFHAPVGKAPDARAVPEGAGALAQVIVRSPQPADDERTDTPTRDPVVAYSRRDAFVTVPTTAVRSNLT
jgi:hypothetical protein